MKKLLFVLLAVIMFQFSANAYDWSMLKTIMGNSHKTKHAPETESVLSNILAPAQPIDNSVQNSFLSIVSKLSSPQESNNLNYQIISILNNSYKTQNEKSELISNIISSYTSALDSKSADYATILRNMSVADRTTVIEEVSNISVEGQRYANLAKQAVSLASSQLKSSSDILTTLSDINNTAIALKHRASSIAGFVNQMRTIAKFAGMLR